MPLHNRVDPWGNIVASSTRGTFMGNRGILHNEEKQITKTHQHQSWVTCKLSFQGIKRTLMSPGNYTELFFLDEATAFAAGHRPCSECRRERYVEFKDFWVKANLGQESSNPKIDAINKIMHKERINRRKKVTYRARLKEIPDGTFFSMSTSAYTIYKGKPFRWSFDGYQLQESSNFPEEVDVLTRMVLV